MPTTTRGIVYPSSTDGPEIWERIQETADSVDSVLDGMNPEPDYFNAYLTGTTLSSTTTVTGFAMAKQASNGGNMALTGAGFGFVAPTAGLYVLSYNLRTQRNNSGDAVWQWRKNASGSGVGGTQEWATYPNPCSATAGNYSATGTVTIPLAASDTLEMFHSCASGTMTNWIGTNSSAVSRITAFRVPGVPSLS